VPGLNRRELVSELKVGGEGEELFEAIVWSVPMLLMHDGVGGDGLAGRLVEDGSRGGERVPARVMWVGRVALNVWEARSFETEGFIR